MDWKAITLYAFTGFLSIRTNKYWSPLIISRSALSLIYAISKIQQAKHWILHEINKLAISKNLILYNHYNYSCIYLSAIVKFLGIT